MRRTFFPRSKLKCAQGFGIPTIFGPPDSLNLHVGTKTSTILQRDEFIFKRVENASMEHAKRGAAALDASQGLIAVGHYTRALIEHPTSPDYFTQRSTAFARLQPARHDLALQDAEYAVVLGQKRQKREKIQAAQQRRVVSLYGLGRYDDAKQILDGMLRWRPKDNKKEKMEHDMWSARIASKLIDQKNDSQSLAIVKEYPEIDLPSDEDMKKWLKSQIRDDGSLRLDGEEVSTDISQLPSNVTTSQHASSSIDVQDEIMVKEAKAEIAAAQENSQKAAAIRHDWYQDNNSVTVTLYAKKVDKTKLKSIITDDHVDLSFPHPDALHETFSFCIDPTYANIDGSASSAKASGAKVELKLVKRDKGVKWPALDDKTRPKTDKLPSAWTTKGEQDWDKKAAEITKKPPKQVNSKAKDDAEAESDADSDFGGDAVDGFFKKLYAGADDDTRRAMMKSFQESNGTALSTNWSEVSKGKVAEVHGKDS